MNGAESGQDYWQGLHRTACAPPMATLPTLVPWLQHALAVP